MKKIKDIIEDLSPEEREKFKELIEECLKNEQELIDSKDKITLSMDSLSKSFENTCNSLCEIEKNILTLKDELKAIEVFSNVQLDKNDLN
jgi:hypothetical protein